MFTDVVESTALINALGDARAHAQTRNHFAVLRRVLSSFDGHELKSTGDGLLATFTSARQAALAAVAMQQAVAREQRLAGSPVRIRIGLNTGEVVEDEGDIFGAAVNVARRICDAAAPGQTLLSDVMVALIGTRTDLNLRSVGQLELRGFTEPVAAHEVVPAEEPRAEHAGAEVPPTAPAIPALLQISDRLPFVGRRTELATLEAEWRRARSERQRLVIIAGEGGIGKSCLARQFVATASGDARFVLHGRADEEHPVPFEPIAPGVAALVDALPPHATSTMPPETLGKLAPVVSSLAQHRAGGHGRHTEPATDDDPARTRFELLDAIVTVAAAASREGALLWVIDDIQWADQSTLLALRHALGAPAAFPLLVVATCREHETAGQPAARIVGELRAQSLETTIRLRGLDVDDVRDLVVASIGTQHAHGDLAKSLYQRTDGHPLFLRELIGDALDSDAVEGLDRGDVPMGVRSVITRRVERLGDAARELLQVAAVVGTRFEVAVLARALDWQRDVFLTALDAAVLSHEIAEVTGAPGTFSFSHDLVRATLYASLPAGAKADLHRQVARAIEDLHVDDIDPVVSALAFHFGMAAVSGTARQAAKYALQAGDHAMQRYAYEEAAEHYHHGVQFAIGTDDTARRAEILLGLGHALVGSGDANAAREAFTSAAEAARLAASPDLFARAALGIGFGGAAVAYADDALIELLEDAESMLAVGHDARRAHVQARLAREVFAAGDHARADNLSQRALKNGTECGDPLALAGALNARHQCLAGPDHLEERLEIQERAVALARESRQPDAVFVSLAGLAVDHLRMGDIRAVDETLATFDTAAGESPPSPRAAWYRATFEVMRAILAGRLVDAERLAADARAAGERAGAYNAVSNHTVQIVGIRRDQVRTAELSEVIAAFAADAIDRESTESADGGWPFLHAQLLAEAGEEAAATRVLDAMAARLHALRRDDFWLIALMTGAEAAVAARHTGVARQLYDTLRPYARKTLVLGGGVLCLGPVDRVLGCLATTLDAPAAAAEHFPAAIAASDRLGGPALRARARFEAAAASAVTDTDHLVEEAVGLCTVAGLDGLERWGRSLVSRRLLF